MNYRALLRRIYHKRDPYSKKGDHGKLLVVGGSKIYSGSPIFNALSAYRAGCDLVTIAAPQAAAPVIKSYLPDMICYPLDGDFLSMRHVKKILSMQKSADAMLIGGGLTRTSNVLSAIKPILNKTVIPMVVDADAIYAVKKLNNRCIVTPHSHEFHFLYGKNISNSVGDRKIKTKNLAKRLGCTVILKGRVDIISDGLRVETNSTGNANMSKGGFGDTLAGIAGALLARGIAPFEAACAAAYINGMAGDLASRKYGEGIIASDLINEIPAVIKIF